MEVVDSDIVDPDSVDLSQCVHLCISVFNKKIIIFKLKSNNNLKNSKILSNKDIKIFCKTVKYVYVSSVIVK